MSEEWCVIALWKRWASKEQSRTQTQTGNRFDRGETKTYDFWNMVDFRQLVQTHPKLEKSPLQL